MVASPRRGEVWICDANPDGGPRPVAVISVDELNDVRNKIVVALGTTRVRSFETEVSIGREEGLRREGVLSGSDIGTIEKGRFLRRAGQLSREKLSRLEEAINLALGLG